MHGRPEPLLTEKCGQCHREGGIGPFALTNYEPAASWATLALEAVEAGEMPPFGAADTEECVPRYSFKDDPRLDEEQLALFADWIIDGTPEGDPNTAAAIPELAGTSLDIRYAKGAPLYFGQLALIGNFGPLGAGMGLQPGPNDSTEDAEFRIPAGAEQHTETMIFALPNSVPPIKIFSTGTHMHYVGTDMLIGIDRLEPEEGTGIQPVDVFLGEETLGEMCLGVFGIAYSILPDPDLRALAHRR